MRSKLTLRSTAAARSKSRARISANSSSISGLNATKTRRTCAGAAAAAALEVGELAVHVDQKGSHLGLHGQRHAALGVGLGLQRVDAVRARLELDEHLVAGAPLVGVQVQGGDARGRGHGDETHDGRD